jgi:hypothetical protein
MKVKNQLMADKDAKKKKIEAVKNLIAHFDLEASFEQWQRQLEKKKKHLRLAEFAKL